MIDGPCDATAYFYVGVFTPDRPGVGQLTSVLRSATEDVLLPALTVTDHVTELRVVRRGEDLSTERPAWGVVWDVIERAEPLEDVMVTATRPSRGRVPEPPFMIVHARPGRGGDRTARSGRPTPSWTSRSDCRDGWWGATGPDGTGRVLGGAGSA